MVTNMNKFDDFTYPNNINSAYDVERYYKTKEEAERKENEKDSRIINAAETIAKNSEKTDDQINKIIKVLLEANDTQKEQLQIIKDIFNSQENSVKYEKEIYELLVQEVKKKHPNIDFAKDKIGDIVVAAITKGEISLFKVIANFLVSKNFHF